MKRESLFISTIAEDGASLALSEGLGLEIAEFCTASNMDADYSRCAGVVAGKMAAARRFAFHAPFNELCPAAIDPLVLEIARYRYRQAFKLAAGLNIKKIIVHSGYVPLVYFKSWFAERSVEFWKDVMSEQKGDIVVCLENVMEDEPELLADIARGVGDERFRLCLDIGHANCQSELPAAEWVERCAPQLEHVHIHNNFGKRDTHGSLGEGSIPMRETLRLIERLSPNATYTIENMYAAASVEWLKTNGLLED